MYNVQMLKPEQIKASPHNARTHSKRQIQEIANSIKAFGFASPVLVDENYTLIAGHGRLQAVRTINLQQIPAVILAGLSEAKKRALALADNKISEKAGWDREKLAVELPVLTEMLILDDLGISITGFGAAEIDQIIIDLENDAADPADDDPADLDSSLISCKGDLWHLGKHRLLCGSVLESNDLDRLMGGDRAAIAFLDPPYNVKVSDIVGRGRIKHDEFAMASGEMSASEFCHFLSNALTKAVAVSADGAVHFVCMDWRSISELIDVGRKAYGAILNLIVWDKTNAGQGSFYRSQHELIAVFRVGKSPHLNNVELGKNGRNRSNVWRYAGVNTFRAGRLDELSMHPTVKPVGLIADALKDCTRRGDVVLDTFAGSGSTILAAERVGRRARALEIEPRFVDAAIRRWQAFTKQDAVQDATGLTFDELAARQVAKMGPVANDRPQGGCDDR